MGYIHLLPSLPQAWPKGYYSGLKARGNFEFYVRWTSGVMTELEITSGSGNNCSVEYSGIQNAKIYESGRLIPFVVIETNRIEFET